MNIRPVGAEFHADSWTDGRSSQFCQRALKKATTPCYNGRA